MPSKGKPKKSKSGVAITNLDNSVKPSTDFYQYACGGWMKLNPLGAEYARYGSFDVLAENNQKQLKDLVLGLAKKKYDAGTVEQKVGDLYKIGMDTVTLNQQGAQPLTNDLQKMAKLQRGQLSATLADLALDGLNPFFGLFGAADPYNSDITIAYLWQTGLGIGDRDYYLEADQQKIRNEYAKLMAQMCKKYQNVYFIQTNACDSKHEATVDGTHPDDYGYRLWAESISKPVVKILKKHGIK